MTDVTARVLRCFAAAFPGVRPQDLPRAAVGSVPEWDSVATLNLLALVEEEFEIRVPNEDLEQFVSYELVCEVVERFLGSK